MEQIERDLRELATRLNTREEYIAWEQRCDEFIESLDERRINAELNIRDYRPVSDNHWSLRSRDLKV